jgi:hypothetical protein
MLTACWDGLIAVLSNMLEAVRIDRCDSLFGRIRSTNRQRTQLQTHLLVGMQHSVRGLHSLANLCNILGRYMCSSRMYRNMQILPGTHCTTILCFPDYRCIFYVYNLALRKRSGWIYAKLVEVSCPLEELRQTNLSHKSTIKTKSCLRTQDALSMQIVIDNAIFCATHAPVCWKHVIR